MLQEAGMITPPLALLKKGPQVHRPVVKDAGGSFCRPILFGRTVVAVDIEQTP